MPPSTWLVVLGIARACNVAKAANHKEAGCDQPSQPSDCLYNVLYKAFYGPNAAARRPGRANVKYRRIRARNERSDQLSLSLCCCHAPPSFRVH